MCNDLKPWMDVNLDREHERASELSTILQILRNTTMPRSVEDGIFILLGDR